jgi:hypothetical protein
MDADVVQPVLKERQKSRNLQKEAGCDLAG